MCVLNMQAAHGGNANIDILREDAYRIIGMAYNSVCEITDGNNDPWQVSREGDELSIIERSPPGSNPDRCRHYDGNFQTIVDDLNNQIVEADGL